MPTTAGELIAASIGWVDDPAERARLQAAWKAAQDAGPDAMLAIIDRLEADHPDALVCDAGALRARIDDDLALDREEAQVISLGRPLHDAGVETPGLPGVLARFTVEREADAKTARALSAACAPPRRHRRPVSRLATPRAPERATRGPREGHGRPRQANAPPDEDPDPDPADDAGPALRRLGVERRRSGDLLPARHFVLRVLARLAARAGL